MKKVDLGVFLPIANNGWIISENAPANMPSYKKLKEIALLSERSGFDYIFSQSLYRGLGGKTEFMNHQLDSPALMNGLAEATSTIKLITTIKIFMYHPVTAAKMLATMDDVSDGRLGVNLVTGYSRTEFTQMGYLEKAKNWSTYRYDYAKEWIDVVKRLWTEERVNYNGEYFQLEDCISNPKPVQEPYPDLVCAGISDAGMNFTIKEAGQSFIAGESFEQIKSLSQKAKKIAKNNNLSVKTHTPVTVILGDTDKEAQELVEYYKEGADIEALEGIHGKLIGTKEKGSNAEMISEQLKNSIFYGCIPMIGSPETIANTIEDLVVNGDLDGVLFTFPDFFKGINDFNEKVSPILVAKGLRMEVQLSDHMR